MEILKIDMEDVTQTPMKEYYDELSKRVKEEMSFDDTKLVTVMGEAISEMYSDCSFQEKRLVFISGGPKLDI